MKVGDLFLMYTYKDVFCVVTNMDPIRYKYIHLGSNWRGIGLGGEYNYVESIYGPKKDFFKVLET